MLLEILGDPKWADNQELVDVLARPLSRLGYIYLAEEKDVTGRPLDPVANFHLGNGANVSPANVNFGANWSTKGLERSLSLMVNYVYSQHWRLQVMDSVTRLGGYLPGLSKSRVHRRPEGVQG
jgi:malonyl-CoA decarboxylase